MTQNHDTYDAMASFAPKPPLYILLIFFYTFLKSGVIASYASCFDLWSPVEPPQPWALCAVATAGKPPKIYAEASGRPSFLETFSGKLLGIALALVVRTPWQPYQGTGGIPGGLRQSVKNVNDVNTNDTNRRPNPVQFRQRHKSENAKSVILISI